MEARKHQKIAGALQVVQGSMLLLFASWYIVLLILEFRAGSEELGGILLIALIVAFVSLWGGVQVWFGCALAMQKPWTSRVGGFICCIPGLIHVPMVFSVYTLWVLVGMLRHSAPRHAPEA